MKLLFLTTHSLATNPRLYKEVSLAIQCGYEVELICLEFENWSKALNEALKQNLPGVTIVSIPAGRQPFGKWFFSVATETMWRKLGKLIRLPLPAVAQAVSRRNHLIISALAKVKPPDWVIGHNPGALYATLVAGQKFGCKTGFDVEDYHPGEGTNAHLQALSRRLMKGVLPMMHYISFASPLIQKSVESDLGATNASWFTLMNYFPQAEFVVPERELSGPLKLVWFSQNVGYGRGLELLLPTIKRFETKLQLHLFGNMDDGFYLREIGNASNILVHAPLPQRDLHHCLANFDVGLALEPAKDRNNELAVSNKILAYLQAGLFILATDTDAQQELLAAFPGHGRCTNFRISDPAHVVEELLAEKDRIRGGRQCRFQNFSTNNWEAESASLLSTWHKN